MSRRIRLITLLAALLTAGGAAALALVPLQSSAEEGGVYVQFGLPGELGAERDRNSHDVLYVRAGTPVTFWNRSGWGHQVAIYDKDLAKNGSAVGTTLADITYPPTGTQVNDPVGRLVLGPSPAEFGCAGPAFCQPLTKGGTDLTYTFTAPGTYLVICNVLPHMVNYAQSTFIVVN